MSVSPKALVVKLSSMGDLFHPLPAVHQLKQQVGLSVDWVTQPEYHDLVTCFSDIDRVIDFPRRRFTKGLRAFLRALRHTEYDYVFDFQGLFKSGMITRMARAKRRIGPGYHREGASMYYDEVAGIRNKNRHAVDEALDFVQNMGLTPATQPVFPVQFPRVQPSGPKPWIAMAPSSRWKTKNWPAEHFMVLGRKALKTTGGTLFLIGGGQDRDTAENIIKGLGGAQAENLCGQTSLPELGGYLAEMDVLFTVDSGPMHMAAALGKPVVAIFGSTDPRRTGPYGDRHVIVQHGGLACQPCRSRICKLPDKSTKCMAELSPETVWNAAQVFIQSFR